MYHFKKFLCINSLLLWKLSGRNLKFRDSHNMKVGGSSPISDFVGLWVNMQRIWSPPWFLILSFVLERCSVPVCSRGAPAAPAWPPALPARMCVLPRGFRRHIVQHQISLDLEFWHVGVLHYQPYIHQTWKACPPALRACILSRAGPSISSLARERGGGPRESTCGFSFGVCQLFWA